MNRFNTRPIKVGNLQIGGQNKVIIQSMTNTKTKNIEETVNQINLLEKKKVARLYELQYLMKMMQTQ